MSKKTVLRYDKGEIQSSSFTPEGFLRADVIVTRTGIFTYRNSDGSLRKELRHPDEVMKKDSLASMEMLPITLLHPKETYVDSSNAKKLSVGFAGENVRPDGKSIRNSILITDQEAIDAVVGGVQELSLGYSIVRDYKSGKYDNEDYDLVQTEITYNHLAIVPRGRAGADARIILDEDDAVQCVGGCTDCKGDGACSCSCNDSQEHTGEITAKGRKVINHDNHNHNHKENRMKKINIDGIEYEASPEVINKLAKETVRADEAETKLTTATEDNTKIQAKLDEATEKITKHDEENKDEKVQVAVKSRLDLIEKSTPHLDEETVKKIADMSDKEVKIAVIKAHYPDANLDEKEDTYIDARFDGAIELETKEDGKTKRDDKIASQRKKVVDGDKKKKNKDNNDDGEPDQVKSRDNMVNDQKDAWKTPVKETA